MELDKRVGDYAAAIVHDADLLLADTGNLNIEQQNAVNQIKRSITRFMFVYEEYRSISQDLEGPQNLSFEFRTPLTSIAGFCQLLRLEVFGSLTPDQVEHVEHIKAAHQFISNAFNTWVNS